MENEYLLFSPSLLKTEVFHLTWIPCQEEEKRNTSAGARAFEPSSQTSTFLFSVALGYLAGKNSHLSSTMTGGG